MNMAKMRLRLNLLFLDPLDLLRVLWRLLESTRKDARSSGSHPRMMVEDLFRNMLWRNLIVRVENGLHVERWMETSLNLNSTIWRLVKR